MINDIDNIEPFLEDGSCKLVIADIAGAKKALGLTMGRGHIVVREQWSLPVVNGYTSSLLFVDSLAGKCGRVLGAPVAESGELRSALFIPGARNYYHFLVANFPSLLMLAGRGEEKLTVLTQHGFPQSLDTFIRETVIPCLTGGRPVEIAQVPHGDYAVRDVVFRMVPPPSLAALMAHRVRKMVWAKAGLKDAQAELGGLKLFVLRQSGASERMLLNQDEVRAWFEARGYTAVDPGALPIEEQILLFSRATHIAGVEGAGLANLLFTAGRPDVTLLASPAVMHETFFPGLAKAVGLRLDMIAGIAEAGPPTRAAHFTLPLSRLDAHAGGDITADWLRRYS